MRKFFKINITNDIKALFWLSSSIFFAVSMYSYNPKDPSLNSLGSRSLPTNLCGYWGSYFSDIFLQLWGISSWGIVVLTGLISIQFIINKKDSRVLSEIISISIFMALGSALSALYFPELKFYAGEISIGGVVGSLVSSFLKKSLNTFGVSIVLWTLVSVNFLIITEFSLLSGLKSLHFLPAVTKKFFSAVRLRHKLTAAVAALQAKFEAVKIKAPQKVVVERAQQPLKFQKQESPVVAESKREAELNLEEEVEEQSAHAPSELKRRKVQLKKDIARKIANWKLPALNMLEDPPDETYKVSQREIEDKTKILIDKFSQFSINGDVKKAKPGPAVTLFEFKPEASVKISKITELADDLSLALSSESVRIIAPIPGRDVVGIETSNSKRETVFLKDIIAVDDFWLEDMKLPITLGREANGNPKVVDLRKMPHLLVAGTTGSGKSVFIVSALLGLLFKHSPKTLRLILIDPKQVDLAAFSKIPHLLMPTICEPKKAVLALKWAVKEMEKRYRSMSKFGARGIEAFNEKMVALSAEDIKKHEEENQNLELEKNHHATFYYTPQPYLMIVVEEFADLMAVDKNNVEQLVVRLAQMARACGIHLVLAMQSPRKDVVTGLIKTNIPGRISFKVASKMDSRIILDESGAERLLARGDMLFLSPGLAKPERHHGPWVSETEINAVMEYWASQGEPEYDEGVMKMMETRSSFGEEMTGEFNSGNEPESDERYDEILSWISTQKIVSASLIQRKFRLGYPRAARLIELFESEGVIGPANGSKPRQVLVNSYEGPN